MSNLQAFSAFLSIKTKIDLFKFGSDSEFRIGDGESKRRKDVEIWKNDL